MIFPELRSIHSPDLEPPQLPPNPADCEVAFEAIIGPKGSPGEEAFRFLVVTPASFRRVPGATWGRGRLVVEAFDWQVVVTAVAELLFRCARPTWAEALAELTHELMPLEKPEASDASVLH